jgi:holo-[acyl-carrier protein] synthase
MILGTGVDIIEIERFKNWHTYSRERLRKVFSEQEISYCLEHTSLSAQRFAVRYAAKEAFFKAWSSVSTHPGSFLALCKSVEICSSDSGMPILIVNLEFASRNVYKQQLSYHISLSHNRSQAIAFVIIQKK